MTQIPTPRRLRNATDSFAFGWKKTLCWSLLALGLAGVPASSQASLDSPYVLALTYGPPVQLLQDPEFHNGFRAFSSCKNFPYDNQGLGHIGECREYYTPYANTQGKNYAIHAWPETGPANYWSDENKFWNFNEGIHAGFTLHGYTFPLELPPDQNNNPDPRNYPTLYPSQFRPFGETEMSGHRLEANQENSNGTIGGLCGLSDNLIWLQSMNNLSTNDPHYGELVRTVSTNRSGEIMMYMNTRNEMRNVAYENSGMFAYDTWPHFFLEQNLKKLIDLATVYQVIVSGSFEIPLAQFLSGWTGGSFQSMDFNTGYMLRRKDNPNVVVFLGYPLYSTVPFNLTGRFFVDQFGSTAYSGNVSDLGGAITPAQSGDGIHNPNNYRYIWFDLRELMGKALTKAASFSYLSDGDPNNDNLEAGRLAFLQTSLEDYYLASFGMGWETLGYQQVQSYVSGLAIYGSPNMIFDAEVYEESPDPNQPSFYKTRYAPGPEWSEGELRAHWAKYGCREGLWASSTFNVNIYMDRWGAPSDPGSASYYNFMPQCYESDGRRNYECAIDHYVIYGRNQGHYGRW
jgi:hypothetical protein